MADATLAKLMRLISAPEAPELRRAAVLVAGSVGTEKDRPLVKALLATLQEADLELRLAAIDALGRLRVEDSLAPLEALVRQGGPELEAAVQAASQLGTRGVRAMGKIMEQATPGLRSRMAAVLAKSGTGGGLVVTAHTLLDDDPKVVDAAARSLATEVPSFSAAQKQALAKFLTESLGTKKGLSAKTEAAMLRVLGTLHNPLADDIFWGRLAAGAAEVRAAALQALGNDAVPPTASRLQRLLACAADPDFQIVAPALMLLKQVPASVKNAKLWLKLLDAPDMATRRFAVDRLRGIESADVARGLLGQLAHPDRALRDEARQALLRFGKGRQALLDRLLEAQSVEESWELARALAPAGKEFSATVRARVLEQAAHHHDQDDRRAASLWFFLREADPGWTRDQIEAKALALRKKKKYPEAVGYFRILAQDAACSEDIRFELAATGLKVSLHDTAVESRQVDPALHQFDRLLQDPSFDLLGRISKAKWLDGADLFYLGFHFVEQTHRARDFGKQVLELVAKRSPRSEVGKNAKKKLRSAGA
jgi:HEAT repeat protein